MSHTWSASFRFVQARLVSLFAGEELGCGLDGVQQRLQDLVQVVPDLGSAHMPVLFFLLPLQAK